MLTKCCSVKQETMERNNQLYQEVDNSSDKILESQLKDEFERRVSVERIHKLGNVFVELVFSYFFQRELNCSVVVLEDN